MTCKVFGLSFAASNGSNPFIHKTRIFYLFMSTRNEIESSTTITGGGGTSTSDSVRLSNEESITVQFQGDIDSTDLSFELQARVDSVDEWSSFEFLPDLDLTTRNGSDTNNVVEQYDVLDLEEFTIKSTNENTVDTTLTIITSHSEQQ